MDKISKYSEEVRDGLMSGVDKLVTPIKITLGAKGRLVAIYDSIRGLHVTKDGYTISKNIQYQSDKLETIAIELVQQAVNNTNSTVGDATTTTAIMCQVLINQGLLEISRGADPMEIKKGMEQGLKFVIEEIKKVSTPIKDSIKKIATISGNNRQDVGEIIEKAFNIAGTNENSSIKILETTDNTTTVEEVNGYKIEKGFLRDSFINHPSRTKCSYKNPYILMVHAKLTSFRDFIPLLKQAQAKQRPLVIIADKFEGEFLNSLEVTLDGQLHQLQAQGGGYFQQIGVIQNPMAFQSAKELYDDMAVVTGSKSSALKVIINDIKIEDLGEAEEVEISRTSSLIIGGKGSKESINKKIKQVEAQMEDEKDLTDFMREVLRERVESLSGSHANIRVGGQNPSEMKELKDLFDDALNAVRASIKEGIVAGGGSALLRIADKMKYKPKNWYERFFFIDNCSIGWNLIIEAIEAPFYQVMFNAREFDIEEIAKGIISRPTNTGYDVLKRDYYNMINEGIIDPAMAERVALENAVSVAIMMHNLEGVVIEKMG